MPDYIAGKTSKSLQVVFQIQVGDAEMFQYSGSMRLGCDLSARLECASIFTYLAKTVRSTLLT